MDVHTKSQRSYNMSRIKGKNTQPEISLRKILWNLGYRYRLHCENLPGKPDIVFPSKNKVIFVNGCFWHKHDCKYFKWPTSNSEFWQAKIKDNVKRDDKNYLKLTELGWKYLVIWECELGEETSNILSKLKNFLV